MAPEIDIADTPFMRCPVCERVLVFSPVFAPDVGTAVGERWFTAWQTAAVLYAIHVRRDLGAEPHPKLFDFLAGQGIDRGLALRVAENHAVERS